MIADAIQDFDGALHVQQSAAQIATVIAADERPVSVGPTDIRRVEKDGKLEFQLAATVERSTSGRGPNP
ncbi:hypothetical protein GGQ73_001612 [Rhizobium skierniewicense]|uniref:Uncharacterized protein n=1 Tax=Rhizobium skierniewicense TaxID=984260 RepID=A0A7W6C9I2_9HYPH|nr:hypothetical protein [Rhizobium skierniewicense]MBB3945677.1 hypothetical protein [Rhizobium skierniewicense]NTF32513.1 hypothetical protein [Rhizobium skierniewicense]